MLGRAFAAAATFQEAFAIYENTRKERANGAQLASRQQADELQGVTERGANPGARIRARTCWPGRNRAIAAAGA